MNENPDKINQLSDKLESLMKKQELFQKEIDELRKEINSLKTPVVLSEPVIEQQIPILEQPQTQVEPEKFTTNQPVNLTEQIKIQPSFSYTENYRTTKFKSDLEKFIGENLINKIGIVITLLGVGIGARYAINHQLISPLTRIILGYLFGLGLLGFAIKLKPKYGNFSAVLLSGSMAIMYFITYSAYDFYGLIPQSLAFVLMVFFTVFTVAASINYNMQVIANIGLVGAYAVPFLLSEGSGRAAILFSYIAIINAGILFIAFKKYWKPLFYSSFILTWLIFSVWYVFSYKASEHFSLSLIFLFIYFTIFYAAFLAYKLIQKEKFGIENVFLLLANSFIFYGFGYAVLSDNMIGEQLLGLFTIVNALIHFAVGTLIYRQKLYDRNLFYFVAGLVLVFISIAIPVQLDGSWVTLLWACEAALLFWIGRTQNVLFYERLSYLLMLLAFFSIFQDWSYSYNNYFPGQLASRLIPLFNINFLNSLLVIAAFSFINFINYNKKYISPLNPVNSLNKLISFFIPCILLVVIYFSFFMEISNYWYQLYTDSLVKIKREGQSYPFNYHDYDLLDFKNIWLFNYSLLFLSILSFINIRKFKSSKLGYINLGLNVFLISIFLLIGLLILSVLRDSYLNHTLSEYYSRTSFNIVIRYISIACFAVLLVSSYQYIHQTFIKKDLTSAFDLLLSISVLWIASSELLNWMDIINSAESYKLALSLLWGVYALALILVGIWKKKKYLRIGAIVLFGITLIKLFFYDISHLETISKTIVLVSLGTLLLIISFLYNKYKHIIFEEHEN